MADKKKICVSLNKSGLRTEIIKQTEVKLDLDVNLVGTTTTRVNKDIGHDVTYYDGDLIIIKQYNGSFILLDDQYNGNPSWHLETSMCIKNAKFLRGKIIQGNISVENSYDEKKYGKQLGVTDDYFTHKGVPVMFAKVLTLNHYKLHAKGIK